jgi:hypothetical protein
MQAAFQKFCKNVADRFGGQVNGKSAEDMTEAVRKSSAIADPDRTA